MTPKAAPIGWVRGKMSATASGTRRGSNIHITYRLIEKDISDAAANKHRCVACCAQLIDYLLIQPARPLVVRVNRPCLSCRPHTQHGADLA